MRSAAESRIQGCTERSIRARGAVKKKVRLREALSRLDLKE